MAIDIYFRLVLIRGGDIYYLCWPFVLCVDDVLIPGRVSFGCERVFCAQ